MMNHYGNDLRVYADGKSLIIPQWGNGCLKMHQPFLESIEADSQRDSYEFHGLRHVVTRPPRITATIISDSAEWFSGSVPDLAEIAESLTVSELFKVIDRKLDRRQ